MPSDAPHVLVEFESARGDTPSDTFRLVDALRPTPASKAFEHGDNDNAAVAVLEHIYRDIIAALQQMYRDTIAAKDDALAGRDRELETKDALIEHLRKRAEDAEGRASQALRFIGEFDQSDARPPQAPAPDRASVKRRGLARLFGK